jgi:vacuolar protein sorting-associated protein 13A/C
MSSILRNVIAYCICETSGAQQEGVEGFFKGVGKGLMGLIIKPAGGVLDCISMALDGIKRWESSAVASLIPILQKYCLDISW